ncbi:DUF4065 domain-containing protein [bacterium]|nr:DUF4065 domain-containing protein [bacterium]MCK4436810.1 DUF4065 domain-containing protein [bacterium]
MLKCKDVADYILKLSDPEIGDIISNLKLQKLLYYCQGFHLALYNKPLFKEDVCAWAHGPVVPEMYRKYKDYGEHGIDPPESIKVSAFTEKQEDLIKEVYKVYGQFSAWKLRNFTHTDPTWKDTPKDEIISHNRMKKYFKTLLKTND